MLRAVVLFCTVLVLTKGQTTPVDQCVGGDPLPLNTYIAGCTEQPCELPQGQDAVIEIIFRAPYAMHRMRTLATAYLGFLGIRYPLGEREVTCNFLTNTHCPVAKDEVIMYSVNLPIETFMIAGTQLPIELRIQDDRNQNILCIRVTVRVTPPVAPSAGVLGARNASMTVEV